MSRHGEKGAGPGKLSIDETTIVGGALEMRNKTVAQVMTPMGEVYMLNAEGTLDAHTLQAILHHGHSRVYDLLSCHHFCLF